MKEILIFFQHIMFYYHKVINRQYDSQYDNAIHNTIDKKINDCTIIGVHYK